MPISCKLCTSKSIISTIICMLAVTSKVYFHLPLIRRSVWNGPWKLPGNGHKPKLAFEPARLFKGFSDAVAPEYIAYIKIFLRNIFLSKYFCLEFTVVESLTDTSMQNKSWAQIPFNMACSISAWLLYLNASKVQVDRPRQKFYAKSYILKEIQQTWRSFSVWISCLD